MRVLVTGGSGFIGVPLVEALCGRGDDVVVTGRDERRLRKRLPAGITTVAWDPPSGPPPASALAGLDGVVNLAGEPVASGRWNKARKDRIQKSRVVGTRNLVAGMLAADPRPRVLVSASAIGYYGDRKQSILYEESTPGDDFLAEVCKAWEAEAWRAREGGIRTAVARVGIVLGRGGGAYPQMSKPFRWFLGATLG
ncbi:MAG TPA: NAD-dependent epimerase/dehydratase family protein, partial [Planctomycetota bacterium]|nr:NAD-dependent epimerase/dehydratase family protein [Planctomycetota bacterium]